MWLQVVYDELRVQGIREYLSESAANRTAAFDLVVSSDVLQYLGDLAWFFPAVKVITGTGHQ
jgi:predicted TPR repeat methyltransferase